MQYNVVCTADSLGKKGKVHLYLHFQIRGLDKQVKLGTLI